MNQCFARNRSPSRLYVDMSVYHAPQPRHLAVLLYHEHTYIPTYKHEGDLFLRLFSEIHTTEYNLLFDRQTCHQTQTGDPISCSWRGAHFML